MNALDEFDRLGRKASYHYADDTTREWGLAQKAKREALAIFDANPEQQPAMRELASKFLWAREFKQDRPE